MYRKETSTHAYIAVFTGLPTITERTSYRRSQNEQSIELNATVRTHKSWQPYLFLLVLLFFDLLPQHLLVLLLLPAWVTIMFT
jgi:hypothetical protein